MFLPLAAAINQAVDQRQVEIDAELRHMEIDAEIDAELRTRMNSISPADAQLCLPMMAELHSRWKHVPAFLLVEKLLMKRAAGVDL